MYIYIYIYTYTALSMQVIYINSRFKFEDRGVKLTNKLDFLLGFFSFSWPLDRLVENEGLFFTRPKHLKTSRAVKKSIAAGFVNN